MIRNSMLTNIWLTDTSRGKLSRRKSRIVMVLEIKYLRKLSLKSQFYRRLSCKKSQFSSSKKRWRMKRWKLWLQRMLCLLVRKLSSNRLLRKVKQVERVKSSQEVSHWTMNLRSLLNNKCLGKLTRLLMIHSYLLIKHHSRLQCRLQSRLNSKHLNQLLRNSSTHLPSQVNKCHNKMNKCLLTRSHK